MEPRSATLAGRRALVTGGASGIGAAIARRLAAEGAAVLVADRDGDAAARLAEEIDGSATHVDLADPDAAAHLGIGIDIVVNNAGMQHVAPVHTYPPDTFSLLLRVMLESPFRIVRSALPGMYQRGWGRVVNISSVHGLRATPFKVAYVAAKHALEGLSKVVAVEGAPHGVTSNCVSPGYTRTALVAQQIADQAVAHRIPPEQVLDDVLLARSPIKRLVEPEEVAELVTWLCGPHARSVTGASFSMDGGWTAN
ncbi:3-hydroxybutyrate dehydrogenase [Streptoalloteichus tenebrarius]|uniref:3-hydroxybutyrate dehydrogenase n=1 Tax=Streptoalloteichus tenebrarius (strain ATCC 17920 / DSM 40477 / JCM 4838 / CBS 697.72 / NBRC 16177 / NCIMB 11028 / NRRL B-12390 / A12253. 1 / ISP 5477) TaxID=1933 RepID=A0ABT1I1D9_STRSD|nr:3-hydroxybutyrate dehydrogenase [Streptoalloteichus tenebrarius]MCP2261579.1 3-hydroxybutyrate dehydrogenase [Streptoalloteichus tenebrarius]